MPALAARANGLGVYIHIPFCEVRCWFCEFTCYAGLASAIPRYLDALATEIARTAERAGGLLRVRSIYLGGGTPSMLDPEAIAALLGLVRRALCVARACEVTLEAHPGVRTEAQMAAYRAAGVTRLSVGVQTFDDRILSILGRTHTAAAGRRTLEAALAAGFGSVSADLIYGTPGQSAATWRRDLRTLRAIDPPHVSTYALKRPEGMGTPRRLDALGGLDPDAAAAMYEDADRMLAGAYAWYEVSNWAKPGHACAYNRGTWRRNAYLGFGAGAHGFVGDVRYVNTGNPRRYIQTIAATGTPSRQYEVVDAAAAHLERVALGLRTRAGLLLSEVPDRHATLRQWASMGLAQIHGSAAVLTVRGRLLADKLALELVAPQPADAPAVSVAI